MKKKYKIEVDCANCAAKAETAICKVAGVKSANISFMTQKLMVEYDDGVDEKSTLENIKKVIKKIDSDIIIK